MISAHAHHSSVDPTSNWSTVLTSERYIHNMDRRQLLRKLPSFGPAWDRAIDLGIDVALLEENLRLSPSQRVEQLHAMTQLIESIRPIDAADTDAHSPSR